MRSNCLDCQANYGAQTAFTGAVAPYYSALISLEQHNEAPFHRACVQTDGADVFPRSV